MQATFNSNEFDKAMTNPKSDAFDHLIPDGDFDVKLVIEKMMDKDKGYEVLKWLIKHKKIDFIEMMKELDEQVLLVELSYFDKNTPEDISPDAKAEVFKRVSPPTLDNLMTRTMIRMICNGHITGFIYIARGGLGNPNDVMQILYNNIIFDDYIDSGIMLELINHKNFLVKCHYPLFSIVAKRGWIDVLEELVAVMRQQTESSEYDS